MSGCARMNSQFSEKGLDSLNPARNRGPDQVQLAQNILNLIGKGKNDSEPIKLNNFNAICSHVLDKKIKITAKIFHQIIRSKGIQKPALMELLNRAPNDFKNVYFYNSIIPYGKNRNLYDICLNAFKEAKEKGLANVVTYNSYIDAAGKNGDLAGAAAAFEETKEKGLANVVTYISYIDAAGKNGDLAGAAAAFEKAKKEGLSDNITYNIFIDVLIKAKNFDKAQPIFKQELLPILQKSQKIDDKITKLDLHDLSEGAAQCALQYLFNEIKPVQKNIRLITGTGLHSKSSRELYDMRHCIEGWINAHIWSWKITSIEEGAISVTNIL